MEFNAAGFLPVGIHEMQWKEFHKKFSFSGKRIEQLDGMKESIKILKQFEVESFYIDGSFVSTKIEPKDWDGCFDKPYDIEENDFITRLEERFPIFDEKLQQNLYQGKFYPSQYIARWDMRFIDFFQLRKNDRRKQKGIIKLKFEDDDLQ